MTAAEWTTQQRPTTRGDVIDNACIHKGDPIGKKRRQLAKHGLSLYYLRS